MRGIVLLLSLLVELDVVSSQFYRPGYGGGFGGYSGPFNPRLPPEYVPGPSSYPGKLYTPGFRIGMVVGC